MPEPEEALDTAGAAQGEEGEVKPEETVDDTGGEQSEEVRPFTKEQENYIGSWLGRIVAKQIDEKVLPHLQPAPQIPQRPVYENAEGESSAIKKFNETLLNRILEGDVLGALQTAQEVQAKAHSSIQTVQKQKLTKEITAYADKPLYKDIYQDMKTIAEGVLSEGYPPEAAARYAYHKARGDYLENRDKGDSSDELALLSGGKRTPRTSKTPVLPPQFKAAFERDKDAGIVKDEKEWIDLLHPSIRKQYGF